MPQKHLLERACGFESRPRHQQDRLVGPRLHPVRMAFRYPAAVRAYAIGRVAGGLLPRQVAVELGVNPTTVYAWLDRDAPHLVGGSGLRCWRCDPTRPTDEAAYAQLLGLYLGDGHLTMARSGACSL